MTSVADLADALAEAPVAPSFTRLGYGLRARLDAWRPLDSYPLHDRVVVLTGATSGLGLAAASQLNALGSSLVLLGRNERKLAAVRERLSRGGSDEAGGRIDTVVADMGDLEAVRVAAETILARHPRVDTLVHNAGALSDRRLVAPDGTEMTVASQVLGPFLLTGLLMDRLVDSAPARVLTMSSGGMYAAGLTVDGLQMGESDYRGAEQYARAKRAQVTLTEIWAQRHADSGVVFHSLHPGWADTPGVRTSLPTFRRLTGPFLRSPEQGADTLVWLVADDEALKASGLFWHDRRPRPTHRLPQTRATDTPQRRSELWEWCLSRTGLSAG
jgi:NAD(P)-dependent dehydrogenase (short-subunit alcohol dehydrogenase family)